MNHEDALQALGLRSAAPLATIKNAVTSCCEELESRRDAAPSEELREKYESELERVREAGRVLLEKPAIPGLSQTQLADLPGSAPSYTIGDADPEQAGARLSLAEGQVLAGRYEIRERIGVGGMGAVFRAYDRNRAEEIAIKVLLPGLLERGSSRERFLGEARLSSALSHPGIVNVFDVQSDGELYFLTMELLEGRTLREEMQEYEASHKQFPILRAIEIVQALCDALAYAHETTVHRDVKPENVFITSDGKIKLMDFGIARVLSVSQLTMTGASMGTAYYMAPEQLKGAKEVDGRADQYSLGVLLYEMLTGIVPAGMISPLRHARDGVSKALDAAVTKSMSPQPASRFPSVRDFSFGLSGRAKMSAGRATGTLSRNRGRAVAVALTIFLIAIGAHAYHDRIGQVWRQVRFDDSSVESARRSAAEARRSYLDLERQLDSVDALKDGKRAAQAFDAEAARLEAAFDDAGAIAAHAASASAWSNMAGIAEGAVEAEVLVHAEVLKRAKAEATDAFNRAKIGLEDYERALAAAERTGSDINRAISAARSVRGREHDEDLLESLRAERALFEKYIEPALRVRYRGGEAYSIARSTLLTVEGELEAKSALWSPAELLALALEAESALAAATRELNGVSALVSDVALSQGRVDALLADVSGVEQIHAQLLVSSVQEALGAELGSAYSSMLDGDFLDGRDRWLEVVSYVDQFAGSSQLFSDWGRAVKLWRACAPRFRGKSLYDEQLLAGDSAMAMLPGIVSGYQQLDGDSVAQARDLLQQSIVQLNDAMAAFDLESPELVEWSPMRELIGLSEGVSFRFTFSEAVSYARLAGTELEVLGAVAVGVPRLGGQSDALDLEACDLAGNKLILEVPVAVTSLVPCSACSRAKICVSCQGKQGDLLVCERCEGAKEVSVTCGDCDGVGVFSCWNCEGGGRVYSKCTTCYGTGSGLFRGSKCTACGGWKKVWNRCSICHGNGRYSCGKCSGRREVAEPCGCTDGTYFKACAGCSGLGVCPSCEGEGWKAPND